MQRDSDIPCTPSMPMRLVAAVDIIIAALTASQTGRARPHVCCKSQVGVDSLSLALTDTPPPLPCGRH